jgi:hypothetical protein
MWKMPNVCQFCIDQLGQISNLNPGLRLGLAIRHYVPTWLEIATKQLIQRSICDLDGEAIKFIPYEAYQIIAKMHEKLITTRMILALQPPPVEHIDSCLNGTHQNKCTRAWSLT